MRQAFVLFTLLAALTAAHAQIVADKLYVSPQGRDTWSGTLAAPNAAKTDGPLATVTAARDAARRLHARLGTTKPVAVVILGGTYRMAEPLVLTPEDSFVAYQAYPGQKVVLSGGLPVTGWQPAEGKLWRATIPAAANRQWQFQQLFVNGQRRLRARTPNLVKPTPTTPLGDTTGYFVTAGKAPPLVDAAGKETSQDSIAFRFKEGDLKNWPNLSDIQVSVYHSWETSRHRLASVDEANRVVTFTGKAVWPFERWGPKQRYFVENLPEALDEPGEWYLDCATGVLSYWPLPGEDLRQAEVIAPRLTRLVELRGDARLGQWVEGVSFTGLTFGHQDWELEPQGHSDAQATVTAPAAIMADAALNCTFKECDLSHVGSYGLWLRAGCKNNLIEGCRIHDLGVGGIRIGEAQMPPSDEITSSGNTVRNCHLFDGGHVYPAGHGIWIGQSFGNLIAHNEIHDFNYSGMSVGWNWGDSPTRTHDNIIEYNHVHHCMNHQLNDGGAIYCLGTSPGSIIRNNVFHDIWPFSGIGWGIYLDATTSQYLVENNVVFNTLSGDLMYNNGGHEHVIQNNIFGPCAQQQLWPYWEKRINTFRRNLIYFTESDLFIPFSEGSLRQRLEANETPAVWDENLYWNPEQPDIKFYGYDFAQWQKLGLDTKSLVADPQWIGTGPHGFPVPALYPDKPGQTLFPVFKPSSPALKLGIKPIDTSTVGIQAPASLVAEARAVKHPATVFPAPPPPPSPTSVDDGFEMATVGAEPEGANVNGEEGGASIRVTAEQAATGRHSAKFIDSPAAQPSWQPHMFYQPHFKTGLIRESFDIYLEPLALMYTEWRDTTPYPANVGPNVTFDASEGQAAKVIVNQNAITTVPLSQWIHVEMETRLGKDAPKTWKLTLQTPGQQPWVSTNIPYGGDRFAEVHWLGFVSTATVKSVFYVDNVKIAQIEK
ncbi:MAG: right-handed parallel beta-helix repeat-containing protein [Armatimonadia bacterium]